MSMATGRRPFEGASEAAVYDALLHGSPPAPSSVRVKLPAQLDSAIGRALEKDRDLRYQSAADLAADLKRLQRPSLSAERPPLLPHRPAASRVWQAATILAPVACGWLASRLWFQPMPAGGSDAQFTLGPPPRLDFALSGTIVPAITLAISPDGRRLVYLAGRRGEQPRLWVRPLTSLEAVPLAGTEDATYPFWSPDGQSLAFFAGGSLKRVELASGALRTLAASIEGRGGTWGRMARFSSARPKDPSFGWHRLAARRHP